MNTKDKCKIVKGVGEFAIGWTVGRVVSTVIQPRGAIDGILTWVGSSALAFAIGGAFDKEFDKFCNAVYCVDMINETEIENE